MDAFSPEDPAAKPLPWFTLPQRQMLAVLVLIGYLGIAGWWSRAGGLGGRLVDIDRTEPKPYHLRLDLNRCDWPLLTVLPGISETMARRIIRHRDGQGPFESVEQLLEVRGIGPKTLQNLSPYLYCGDPGKRAPSSNPRYARTRAARKLVE